MLKLDWCSFSADAGPLLGLYLNKAQTSADDACIPEQNALACKSMSTLITGPGPIFWNAALGDFNLLVALWVEHAVV